MTKVLTKEDFEEADKTKDTSAKETEEKVESKAEPEKKIESSENEEESLSKSSDQKTYKYASMDEYDKAYKEAEKKMHEATTEKAELRRKLDYFERPAIEKPVTIDDRVKEIRKDTMQKIKMLPSDSPTRDDDAADFWGDYTRKVARIEYEENQRKADTERTMTSRIYETATKEGMKTNAELKILGNEFSKTDPSLALDDRIQRAIEGTRSVISELRDGFVQKQELDKRDKDDLKVLGRGSSRREKSEGKDKETLGTLSDDLAKLNESRKLRNEDLRY